MPCRSRIVPTRAPRRQVSRREPQSEGVKILLRAEGFALLAAATAGYCPRQLFIGYCSQPCFLNRIWAYLILLFFSPSSSAADYNLVHSTDRPARARRRGTLPLGAPLAASGRPGCARAHWLRPGARLRPEIFRGLPRNAISSAATKIIGEFSMRIHAIETGKVKIKASPALGRGHGFLRRLAPLVDNDWTDWLPTYAFAIEHRDGVILVDTGANAGLKALPRWHPYFRFAVRFEIEREQEAGPQLRAFGISARDVKTVVLTHLHMDHDGGLKDFGSQRNPCQPWRAQGRLRRRRPDQRLLPQHWPRGFDPQADRPCRRTLWAVPPLRAAHGGRAVVAIPTPGHTPDHLSIVIEDRAARRDCGRRVQYRGDPDLGQNRRDKRK